MGIFYRPLSQDEDTNELFFKKLRSISTSATLVFVGHFSLPDVMWEHHTDDTNRSRRVLKHMDDNFLVWVLRQPAGKVALLDSFLVNREDLMSKMEMSGCLGHSNHEAIEFKNLCCQEAKCQQKFNSGHEENKLQAAEGSNQ